MKTIEFLDYYIKIWADTYGKITGETKGGHVNLSYETFIICSNYSIDQAIGTNDQMLNEAVRRRFKEI